MLFPSYHSQLLPMETQTLPFYKYCRRKITILSHIQRRIGDTDGIEQQSSGKAGGREEREQGEKREGKGNRIGEGPLNGCTTVPSHQLSSAIGLGRATCL